MDTLETKAVPVELLDLIAVNLQRYNETLDTINRDAGIEVWAIKAEVSSILDELKK